MEEQPQRETVREPELVPGLVPGLGQELVPEQVPVRELAVGLVLGLVSAEEHVRAPEVELPRQEPERTSHEVYRRSA